MIFAQVWVHHVIMKSVHTRAQFWTVISQQQGLQSTSGLLRTLLPSDAQHLGLYFRSCLFKSQIFWACLLSGWNRNLITETIYLALLSIRVLASASCWAQWMCFRWNHINFMCVSLFFFHVQADCAEMPSLSSTGWCSVPSNLFHCASDTISKVLKAFCLAVIVISSLNPQFPLLLIT